MKFIGLLAAFAGLAIAFADALRLPTYQELAGDMMCLAGAVLWAATIVLIKASSLARTSSEKTLLYQLAVSAALLPAGSYLLGEEGISSPSWLAIIALIYQTLLVASVSYVAWFWLMTRYPASRLSAFTFLTPVLGVAFGGLLLGEQISPALIASLALIAAGIYLVNRPMRS